MSERKYELENSQEAISAPEKRREIDCDNTQTPAANAPNRRLDHENYTVGWICAITTEYVAASEFLDEEHERPDHLAQSDNNDYTLGRVGKHNVVIAVLPDGEYGTASAASVARDMLHSFPNIRIGLMVGIGGGVPSRKHDIRLGDIVVSSPRDGDSGVFQYDFGKTIQAQSFQVTGFLNQPPMILRTAVNGLKAQYERKGNRFEEAIHSILKRNPRLQQKYKRLDSSNDRLYRAKFPHLLNDQVEFAHLPNDQAKLTYPPNGQASCTAVCGDDPANLIFRHKRTEVEDNPAVHYGLIASANQLMKDALVRDKLAMEKDILCFEMEAAGLMNHFPCQVIRGICDYSDSHKNKEWQGYAAMAAAAYTKDLLYRISPKSVEAETKIVDILSGVLDTVSRTEANVEAVKCKLDGEKDLKILNWLTSIDYGPQQSDYIRRRQAETGQWFLDSEKFQTWLKASKQTLFCPGIPGAGKTIITAIVINDLHIRFFDKQTIGVAYIYCNFRQRDEQKAHDLLASLLKQLSQERPTLPDTVKDLYDRHKAKRTRPLFDELSKALHTVVAMHSRVFIIVDALDECQLSDGSLTRFLTELLSLQDKCGANLFATSRPIPEIMGKFERSMSLEIRANKVDVERYLDGHMFKLPRFVARSCELQEKIKSEIAKAVDGMFLLAQLHLDSLIGKRSPRAIQNALEKLPTGSEGYDHAYKDAMERIKGQLIEQVELAKQVLSWIVCARRPLATLELRHGLAIRPSDSELDEQNLSDIVDIVSVCAGLVTVDEDSGITRLVHYTTQDYFERTQKKWFPDAEDDIAMACVTYLSFRTFGNGFCATDKEFEERLQSSRLYDYAARNWGHHAHAASTVIEQLIQDLLENEANVSAASQAMMASGSYIGYSQRVPRQMTGVHLAAHFGLAGTIIGVLKNGYNPDVRNSYGETPLLWAAQKGHEAVVKLLLAKDGVDINSKDSRWGQTPLSWAAWEGREAVVKLLLEKDGADINSKDSNLGQTPLTWAAQRGHEAVVKLLLEKDGVDINSKDSRWGQTPLSWAAQRGHEAVVKLLLEKDGVDISSKDSRWGQTPLSWAAQRGHEAVVKLLLEKDGVDISSNGSRWGQTPLSWAARNGHEAVVKLLLEKDGADINSKDSYLGQTPLSWAAREGREAVVKLLLEKDGVDINSKDSNLGQTPLSWAAYEGHEAVVKLLQSHSALS
ncbi:MAG: hypothetical protein M1839_001733 [Geoglossum umbratile]|nr:MAG: hypothetical protein M1839_001733 [Geoglossum umbratile]